MKSFGKILWGIVFIVLGFIWGLNSLGFTTINVFFSGWWTLFIIVPCFIGLFTNSNKTGDFVGLIIGILLLLCAQGLFSFSLLFKLAIPIILVVIGISILFGSAINTKINQKIRQLNKDGLDGYAATFGEQKVNMANQEFKGANLDAIFGSVELSLRDAIIKEDQIINASAIFGGIEIDMPSNVNVKVKSTPIFGGVSNRSNSAMKQNVPTIYINAYCMFGGVEIK